MQVLVTMLQDLICHKNNSILLELGMDWLKHQVNWLMLSVQLNMDNNIQVGLLQETVDINLPKLTVHLLLLKVHNSTEMLPPLLVQNIKPHKLPHLQPQLETTVL